MELVQNGRHMVYNMRIETSQSSYGGGEYQVVHYKYGSFGTMGKSNIKCFFDDTERDVEDGQPRRSAMDKATEFVTNKYYELWGKGYRDEGSQVDDNGPFRPVKNVGEVYYMEKKDKYNGERSFYQIQVQFHREGEYFIEVKQGEIGGNGFISGDNADELEEALEIVAQRAKEYGEMGYKKKTTPKTINCRIVNNCGWSESESESSDDSDSGDDDTKISRNKAGRKLANTTQVQKINQQLSVVTPVESTTMSDTIQGSSTESSHENGSLEDVTVQKNRKKRSLPSTIATTANRSSKKIHENER